MKVQENLKQFQLYLDVVILDQRAMHPHVFSAQSAISMQSQPEKVDYS